MGFYCIKCCKCGNWYLQENRTKGLLETNCRCKRCGKTYKLFLKKRKYIGSQAIFYGPYDVRDASVMIAKIKQDEATNHGELFKAELNEFETCILK